MLEEPRGFRREIRLFDATMVVVGSMVGSGIFIVSADIARTLGGSGWLLAVWVATGLMTVAGALCYGELAGMMPQAGGQYVYLREAYGPLVAFLYGWTFFLVIQAGTIAAVGVAFAKFTAQLVPFFSASNVLARVGPFEVNAAQGLGIASIALLTAVNAAGLRHGRRIQNAFTVSKTVALAGVIGIGVLVGANADVARANFADPFAAAWVRDAAGGGGRVVELLSGLGLAAAFGAAMVGSLFSSDAWNNITFAAGEAIDPRRTIPRALALGTALVSVLYVLANVGYLLVLPVAAIAHAPDDRVGTAMVATVFGGGAAALMAVIILFSTFGCNNGLILAGARVTYAMAQDGLFFRGAGRLNRHGVPGVALLVQGVWAAVLCLSGTYGQLLDYVVFAVLLFYILTVGALFVLRRRRPQAERPTRAPGYPLLPALYMAAAGLIALDLLVVKPAFTWPGLLIVALGIPVYAGWRRQRA